MNKFPVRLAAAHPIHLVSVATALLTCCFQTPPDTAGEEAELARADLKDANGARIGSVTFTRKPERVDVSIALSGVADGEHGVHVHVEGACDGPDFKSAGGHWDPTMDDHGAPGADHHHAGDLGNVIVESSTGKSKLTLVGINLIDGDVSSVLGHAVIVHEQGDDFMTQMPPGNAGARIGCGIIEVVEDGEMPGPGPVRPNQQVSVAGKVTEMGAHFSGAGETAAVTGANISTLGLNPEQTAESGADGNYTLKLPQNGKTIVHTSKQGYFPTHTEITTTANNISGKRLYTTNAEYMSSIAAVHNVDLETTFACHAPPQGGLSADEQCVYGIIVGQVIDDGTAGNGVPTAVSNIAKNDITILGPDNAAAWYTKGPYFLTSTGAASLDQLRTARNGLFVAFVEIPATAGPVSRDFKIQIRAQGANGTRYFGPTNIKAYRPNGVTFTYVRETGQPPPPMEMPMEPTDPGEPVDFDTQIYPLFLSVTQGGYGCLGCHTNADGAQPAAGFNLYGGPADAYAALNPAMYPERVNIMQPSMSLLLSKPLYEDNGMQNHPIAAFISRTDEGYVLIQRWIRQGGMRTAPVATVSFANDVVKLLATATEVGGAGCVTCHGVEPAPGNFYVGGTPDLLYAELTTEAPAAVGEELLRINKLDPAKSLLLINPLVGSGEPHPVKLFSSNADARYSILYRWIAEGAEKN